MFCGSRIDYLSYISKKKQGEKELWVISALDSSISMWEFMSVPLSLSYYTNSKISISLLINEQSKTKD